MKFLIVLPLALQVACIMPPVKKPAETTPPPVSNLELVPATIPHCANLPPVCKGGLVKQPFTGLELNNYVAKYATTGCRYTEPPRCYTKQVRTCLEQCTP